ncbi:MULTISPECIES: ADP-ribosyltransferase [unclassified Rhodococcus (in: high G+C Gram-positive bacteria)]|uniref:ADP-ribosyltransferase n=1 Tax=unclassified Rhodococcus (in: high G+C Gram-positive bacteria) TaxID=192944 RepID=UPI0005E2B42B|nr:MULTISPECIES: ADP-ribosyltransferase [unclassified Rhodococcus (in: high G+C Gram-positive bacteria)]KJF21960.1 ADP-ribosyltransferase exoenzyme [Rhodococcus sp. AD45]
MARTDPWLAERMRADARIRRGEKKVYAGVITAMTIWLDTARQLVLGQPVPALTAAADDPIPDIDAAQASFAAWARALEQHVEPAIAEAFGEAFAAQSRAADISPVHYQEHHMATVHDRLKIWPEGAFEELRPELLEAMQQNESIDGQITDRIARILDIDAPTRRIRADISAIDAEIADPETDREEIPFLKGKRLSLWNQHDESQQQWRWLARRIARTEIQGAVEGGSLASAQATAEVTGRPMFKAWLSTSDERTRASHNVADGQIVKLAEPFRVGTALLNHPAFPGGPAHEVINCRCTMRILSESEMQQELQGMWGGRGVSPMGARLGPDDEADAATAIDRLNRERRGEIFDPIERTEPDVQDTVNVDDDIQVNPDLLEPDDEEFTTPHDDIPDLEDEIPDDELHVADEEPDLDSDDEELPDDVDDERDSTDLVDNETEPEDDQPDTDPADEADIDEEITPAPAPTEPEILEPIIETAPAPEPLVFDNLDDAHTWASQAWPLSTRSFDRDIARAVTLYTGDGHRSMNRGLREGDLSTISGRAYRSIREMRTAIDEAPRVPEPVDVFREVSATQAFQLQRGDDPATLLGRAFTDLGFMSTSLTQSTAGAAHSSMEDVTIRMTVPAGYAAIYVSGAAGQAPSEILSQYGNAEAELILKDGTTIVFTGIEFDQNGRLILQAEVIDTTEGE